MEKIDGISESEARKSGRSRAERDVNCGCEGKNYIHESDMTMAAMMTIIMLKWNFPLKHNRKPSQAKPS